ncbi:MAG: hypothetical protein O3C22_07520 [Bacteroidetes bacterium]|nr:hypothetical protein [Bacteroidota bacterium]MDA0944073.1 hypothetical protein [Bacteroidota bacterium]MDA1112244.1 hypothetical protein [Bacteroidota bacterium]
MKRLVRKSLLLMALGLLFSASLWAQVPKIGSGDRLDIASWNIEWFGDASNGPSSEVTQLNNAAALIKNADLDLWGLCEISNAAYWADLQQQLPDYGAVISTWSQSQKTALLYKKSEFTLLWSKHILQVYDYEFASGRLPLEVGLGCTLNGKYDTLVAWVIHLKANTGSTASKATAWDRRKRAMEAMKSYIADQGAIKGVVLGDWNDDLDKSIFSNYATPFSAWMADTNFAMVSYPLSVSGQRSTVSYSDMIDHQAATPALKPFWVRDSSSVLYADKYISGYGNNTSDHYPVYAHYYWNLPNASVESVKSNTRVWHDGTHWNAELTGPCLWVIYDAQCREVYRGSELSEFIGQPGQLYAFWAEQSTGIHGLSAWVLQP